MNVPDTEGQTSFSVLPQKRARSVSMYSSPLEPAMSRMIKVGNHEFHVLVQPLYAGGFSFTVVDIDLTGPKVIEVRHESALRFDTEEGAYNGGSAHARRRARMYRH
jgi:hypothetical protein